MTGKLVGLLVLLCIFLSYPCKAQSSVSNLGLNHYTDDNGLPQNSIKSIAPDQAGYIWLATENGLVRFDGQRFYAFTKANTAFPSNRFYSLIPDLANQSPGLSDRLYATDERGNYIRLQNGKAMLDSLYAVRMSQLPYGNDFFKPGMKAILSAGLPSYVLSDPAYQVYLLQVKGCPGCFYLCTHQSVSFYEQWQKKYTLPLPNIQFGGLFVMGKTLFYHQPNGHLAYFDQTRSALIPVCITGDEQLLYGGNPTIEELYWNNAADQVFLYSNKKLYHLTELATGCLSTRLLLDDFDLLENGVRSIYYDETGRRIFLGSSTKGLFVFSGKPFETLTADPKRMDSNFYAQIPYSDNSVLTAAGTILGKEPTTGKPIFQILPLMAHNKEGQRSLVTDQKKSIWTRSLTELIRFSPDGKRQTGLWPLQDAFQIYQDPDQQTIWIGGELTGLSLIHPLDSVPRIERVIPALKQAIYFLKERPDKLLVGTTHGLYRVHIPTRKVQFIEGTGDFAIRSLYQPRPEEIWFTTYGDGFFLLLKNRLIRFPLDDNQYLATSHHIFEDKKGYFWLPTNKGLFQMAHRDLLDYALGKRSDRPFYLYYTKENGFLTNEFNGGCQPGIIRLATGYVSIPSLQGLVWFRPESFRPPLPTAPLLLDRMEENGRPIPIKGDTILLPQHPQQIRFHLATPYFNNVNNLQLTYQLTRTDDPAQSDGWIPIDSRESTILLSNLAAGTYRLNVRKINGFGVNNYSYSRHVVIVPPLWYQTWWMRVGLLLVALLGIYLVVRIRFRYILRENQKLENLVAARTISLQKSEDELNRQLHLQTHLIASISHDVQSPLQFVTNVAQRMSQFTADKNYEALHKAMGIIANTTQTTSDLLRQLLAYSRTRIYEGPKEPESVDLQALIDAKHHLFQSLLTQKHNRFLNEVPLGLQVRSESHLLGIIIHNLIDNAVKYTDKGQIRLYVDWVDHQLHLIISNSGSGMSAQTIDWFNEQNQSESVTKLIETNQRGVGLLIVKEIAELIHVKIFIDQTENTAVHLVFGS